MESKWYKGRIGSHILATLQPQLFLFLQRKRMQLWSKESRFLIGTINMARIRVQQQSTLIHSTLTFGSSSRLSHLGLNMKLNGACNGHSLAKHLTGVPNKFDKQNTQKILRWWTSGSQKQWGMDWRTLRDTGKLHHQVPKQFKMKGNGSKESSRSMGMSCMTSLTWTKQHT